METGLSNGAFRHFHVPPCDRDAGFQSPRRRPAGARPKSKTQPPKSEAPTPKSETSNALCRTVCTRNAWFCM
eukprot:1128162-Rhodomonas_salina.1